MILHRQAKRSEIISALKETVTTHVWATNESAMDLAITESRRRNEVGAATLLCSNVMVCVALYLLKHSADGAAARTLYLLAANAGAGLVGFLPFRHENAIRIDRPSLAVIGWSACYCTEYGLFLVYPGVISISQLIVCNSLAPFISVYLSQDAKRSGLGLRHRVLSLAPIIFLLGIAFIERRGSDRTFRYGTLLLACVLTSAACSQACARYVARHRSPGWSQPRLTILNAVLLAAVLFLFSRGPVVGMPKAFNVSLVVAVGTLILLVQRFYVFGLRKADPFISALALCSIVPLSLATEAVFEHRLIGHTEIALSGAYMISTAASVLLSR
jgi:hypothetical protein